MGVDPDCLKAGGAAGGVNENRWDPADYEALLAYYADPFIRSQPAPPPVLYDLPGSSPQNALENHSANQQIFAWICSGTVTIAASVDPGACAWSIFTTGQPLNRRRPLPSAQRGAGRPLCGRAQRRRRRASSTRSRRKRRERRRNFTPVRNLNDDFNDGIITALNSRAINSPDQILASTRCNDFLTLDSSSATSSAR